MRTLTFTAGSVDAQRRYALIQLAFNNSQRANSPNDLKTINDLITSVNKIGTTSDDEDEDERESSDPDSVEVAERMRRLSDEGGRVKLESAEYKILRELIDQCKWKPSFAPGIVDLKEFLTKAPKDKKKAADGGKDEPDEPT